MDHLPAANPEHRRTGESNEQDRDGFRDVTEFLEPLPGVQLACLMAAPAGEKVVLGRGRTQGLDVAQAGDADTDPQTLLAIQAVAFVGSVAAGETRHGGARHGDDDHHGREPGVVDDHQRQKGETHRQIDGDAHELNDANGDDLLDRLRPRQKISRHAPGEELGRPAQQAADEAVRLTDGDGDRQTAQRPLAKPGEDIDGDAGGGHGADQCAAPVVLTASENIVDEQPEQHRRRNSRHRKQQPGQEREEE